MASKSVWGEGLAGRSEEIFPQKPYRDDGSVIVGEGVISRKLGDWVAGDLGGLILMAVE